MEANVISSYVLILFSECEHLLIFVVRLLVYVEIQSLSSNVCIHISKNPQNPNVHQYINIYQLCRNNCGIFMQRNTTYTKGMHTTTWINLEIILLSERSQEKNHVYYWYKFINIFLFVNINIQSWCKFLENTSYFLVAESNQLLPEPGIGWN